MRGLICPHGLAASFEKYQLPVSRWTLWVYRQCRHMLAAQTSWCLPIRAQSYLPRLMLLNFFPRGVWCYYSQRIWPSLHILRKWIPNKHIMAHFAVVSYFTSTGLHIWLFVFAKKKLSVQLSYLWDKDKYQYFEHDAFFFLIFCSHFIWIFNLPKRNQQIRIIFMSTAVPEKNFNEYYKVKRNCKKINRLKF